MSNLPIGYLITVVLAAWCTLLALAPPRPAHSSPSNVSFWFGYLVNELPFPVFYWLLASTVLALVQGDLGSTGGRVVAGLAALTTAGLGGVAWRGLRAGPAVDRAMGEGLGSGWRAAIDADLAAGLRRHLPWARILCWPFPVRPRQVERVANLAYGDAGRQNLLDLYRHRAHPAGAPTLVYFHGGAFRSGGKHREARPLLHRLASQGWVCVSANYRLSPAAKFPDSHLDARRVIAWVRANGHQHGADPSVLFVAGSSAGAHLASMVALTDPSVTGVVCLYGYYGPLDARPSSSPAGYARPDAPPFLVAHGDTDTFVLVEDARRFAGKLASVSTSPVVYAELPGAQHVFDLFHSIRFETVVNAVDAFAAWVRSRETAGHPPSGP